MSQALATKLASYLDLHQEHGTRDAHRTVIVATRNPASSAKPRGQFGSLTRKVVPTPGVEVAVRLPLWAATML